MSPRAAPGAAVIMSWISRRGTCSSASNGSAKISDMPVDRLAASSSAKSLRSMSKLLPRRSNRPTVSGRWLCSRRFKYEGLISSASAIAVCDNPIVLRNRRSLCPTRIFSCILSSSHCPSNASCLDKKRPKRNISLLINENCKYFTIFKFSLFSFLSERAPVHGYSGKMLHPI